MAEIKNVKNDLRELKSFLEAEIATLYPDLRLRDQIGTEVPEGEIQGCVQFNRYYSDDTSELLEFMPYDEFSCEVAKLGAKLDEEELQEQIYFNKTDVESQYNLLKDKFTMDDNNNLIIIGMYSSEKIVEYSDYAEEEGMQDGDGNSYTFGIQIERINYQSVIEKYTMPFEFCLALLLVTDNNGFCEEVANLAKNSTIIIDIQDNSTTTVMQDKYSYVSDFKKQRYVEYYEVHTEEREQNQSTSDKLNDKYKKPETVTHRVYHNYDPYPVEASEAIEVDDYSIITNIIKSNNITLCVKNVDTWIANFTSTYDNIEENTSSENTGEFEDDEEYREVQNYHNLSFPSISVPAGGTISKDEQKLYEKQYDKQTVYTVDTTTNSYNKTSSEVEETPEKFLSLLKVDPDTGEFDLDNLSNNTQIMKYEILNGSQSSPIDNLLTAKELLYELLASNSKTVNLEDTMRYLIDLYNGRTSVDTNRFSIYEPGQFYIAGTGIYGGTIQEKVWFALKDLGYSDIAVAGAMGNIDYESAGFSTTAVEAGSGNGIGLCQWSFGRRISLENYAAYKGVSWQDEDMQVEFLVAEISGQGLASGFANQRVSGYIVEEGELSTVNDWANAQNISDATLHFMRFFESPQSRESLEERISRAQNYYNEFEGLEMPVNIATQLTGANRYNMIALIAEAIRIANDDTYQYSQDYRNTEFYYDCSSFVSRLYAEFFGISRLDSGSYNRGTDNIRNNSMLQRTDINNLQSGDILWKDGHVALYIGDGQIAEAKGVDYGIVLDVLTLNRFSEAYRLII